MRPSKKEEILQKSLKIFYAHGFHATGVDFIAKKTGISKTSIYSNFSNKDALILAVLQRRDENFRHWLISRVNNLANTPIDKILCIFDALDEWFNENEFSSCMFIKASSEYQEHSHPFYQQSVDHKNKLKQYFAQLVKATGIKSPENIVNHMVILKEGAIISAHLKLMEKPGLQAKKMLLPLLKEQLTNSLPS